MPKDTQSAARVGHDLDFESMDAEDWRTYLTETGHRLIINAEDGVHTVEYDDDTGDVTFYANGSLGYDTDGTDAVLTEIAGSSDGLEVRP